MKRLRHIFQRIYIEQNDNCLFTYSKPQSLLAEALPSSESSPSGFLDFLVRNFGPSVRGTMSLFLITLLAFLGIVLLSSFAVNPLSAIVIGGSLETMFGLVVMGVKVFALITAAFTIGMGVKAVSIDYKEHKNARSSDSDYFWLPYLQDKFEKEFVPWADSPGNVANLVFGSILLATVIALLICAGPLGIAIPGITAAITFVGEAFATSLLFGGSYLFTAFFLGSAVMGTYVLLSRVVDTVVEFFDHRNDVIEIEGELYDRDEIAKEMTSLDDDVEVVNDDNVGFNGSVLSQQKDNPMNLQEDNKDSKKEDSAESSSHVEDDVARASQNKHT